AALAAGALPLLAFGANAAPAVLARKLGARVAAATLVAEATLRDADVAFSAHVSPHGAIPATLVPSPGTAVAVRVLALPPEALAALDATEPNYVRGALAGAQVFLADGSPVPGLLAYRSRHGPLRLEGGPVALEALPARRRSLPALTQAALLEALRRKLDPGADADAFVLAGVRDAGVREARTRALRELGRVGGAQGRRSGGR
ncbi:MAG: hypothetical protein M3P39_05660, partial [Actinomycetota bacterium]|nr:hypothetical protein [Actinomycetota bacterium]